MAQEKGRKTKVRQLVAHSSITVVKYYNQSIDFEAKHRFLAKEIVLKIFVVLILESNIIIMMKYANMCRNKAYDKA